MLELLEASVSLVNILPTTLLVFVLIYWLIVMLGVIDMNAIDFYHDIDMHHEVHPTLHMDVDLPTSNVAAKEVHTGVTNVSDQSINWLNATLAFFNLGKVPFMVFMSFLILPIWVISVLLNYYLGNTSVIIAIFLLIPNIMVSFFIAKFLTTPFVKIFSYLHKDPDAQEVVGQVCTVLLPASSEKLGQAIINNKGNTILLNVKPADGFQLDKGKSAIVIEFIKDKKYYLVQSFDI